MPDSGTSRLYAVLKDRIFLSPQRWRYVRAALNAFSSTCIEHLPVITMHVGRFIA
jgi:hypothetical protein